MNFSVNEIVTWVAMAVGLIGVWFRNQYKIERLEEKHKEVLDRIKEHGDEDLRQLTALWKWKDEHEKDSNSIREEFNRGLSELRGGTMVINEQFKQIMAFLQDLKERMIKLEGK